MHGTNDGRPPVAQAFRPARGSPKGLRYAECMRIFQSVLIVFLSFASGTFTYAQSPKIEAAATVLAATREALGGEKKLAAVKTLIATGRRCFRARPLRSPGSRTRRKRSPWRR